MHKLGLTWRYLDSGFLLFVSILMIGITIFLFNNNAIVFGFFNNSGTDIFDKNIEFLTNNTETYYKYHNMIKDFVIEQKTVMSKPAPVKHPDQPIHQVVFALPLLGPESIWSGKVTFTASKPIEVEVLQWYTPEVQPDSKHGEPYNAILPGNKSIAISHFRGLVDVPIEINGTGISSGTFEFAGSALVFHKTTGEPFTITYTIDAAEKSISSN